MHEFYILSDSLFIFQENWRLKPKKDLKRIILNSELYCIFLLAALITVTLTEGAKEKPTTNGMRAKVGNPK